MISQSQPRFFLYRFCLEPDARIRNTIPPTSQLFCTVRVPTPIQTSLLRSTSFLSGAYIHNSSSINILPAFGKSVPASWASFLEREAAAYETNQHKKTPAFLTQAEWDFMWKHTRHMTYMLREDMLRAFNAHFSRRYGTFQLLAAMINTFVLPHCLTRDACALQAFRGAWNGSLLVRDVLGLPLLSVLQKRGEIVPAPVSAAECRDKFCTRLLSSLDRAIDLFGAQGNRRDAKMLISGGEEKEEGEVQ